MKAENMKYLLFIILLIVVIITTGCVGENKNTVIAPTQTIMVPTIAPTQSIVQESVCKWKGNMRDMELAYTWDCSQHMTEVYPKPTLPLSIPSSSASVSVMCPDGYMAPATLKPECQNFFDK
jgi:hypothetical protein